MKLLSLALLGVSLLSLSVAACGGTTVTTSGAGGAGGGGGGGAGASGGAGGAAALCAAPVELAPGLEQCEGGLVHRLGATTCESELPRAGLTCDLDPGSGACDEDVDCVDQPNGFCEAVYGGAGGFCTCKYGCLDDADCGAGSICVCGDPVGRCAPAGCASDDDCAPGSLCLSFSICDADAPGFACVAPSDECLLASDCGTSGFELCTFDGELGHRVCGECLPKP